MGRKTRIALTMVLGAVWMALAGAALDHRRPGREDLVTGVVYLGTFLLLGVIWMAVESLVRSRRGS